jgi:hypothetical protein
MREKDAANLRLASRYWGGIGAEGLFNIICGQVAAPIQYIRQRFSTHKNMIQAGVLEIRPHCNDMVRMMEISKRPWLAKHIKEVVVYTGDFLSEAFPASMYVFTSFQLADINHS